MSSVFLSAPSMVPSPIGGRADWEAMTHTWEGWDGSEWRLSDTKSGVYLLGGVRGLTMPTFHRYKSQSPAIPGSRYRGQVAEEREVFWPLKVYSNAGSRAWVEYDRAFWRTMHPAHVGVWTVKQPNGSTRSLQLRFDNDGQQSFRTDPARIGWVNYGITLVAEQPFWQGRPIRRTWRAGAAVDFFNGGAAPPFRIASASTLTGATMNNPGDEDAFPVWTIIGPTTSVELGVGGRIIEVPFAVADGRLLVTDPRPTEQSAIEIDAPPMGVNVGSDAWDDWLVDHLPTGLDRTTELGAVDFAPVPPGESVQLSLSMVGSGVVAATLIPLYHRAW